MAGTLTPWPGLPPTVHVRRGRSTPPYPFGGSAPFVLHASARTGLAAGLRALGVGAGRRVLMPAWHHGSEVEAVLSTGARCLFYDVEPGGSPVSSHLETLGREGDVLHLTHLLGLPQDAGAWRRWCDDRGMLFVEDAAQAWTSSYDGVPVGSHGDLAVWCLYKTVGVPDGAAIRCSVPLEPPAGAGGGVAVRKTARRHAAWVAQALPLGARRTPAPYDVEADMGMTQPAGASAVTRWLLPRIDYEGVAAARRRNFAAWAGAVAPLDGFGALPPGAVPMVFPLAVEDKAAVLARLRSLGVAALDFWRASHPAAPRGEFARVDWLRDHVIGLPVHQEISKRRLRRAVDVCAPTLLASRC